MKQFFLITTLCATLPFAQAAWAADEQNLAPGISAAGAPVALHGADPVALKAGTTTDGDAAYVAVHDGASYYFATAENQAAFEAAPESYRAQNGGFCTFGVSVGKKFDGDPRYAHVQDGKLYVFLNADTRDAYLKDIPGTLAKAQANWEKIEHIAASEL